MSLSIDATGAYCFSRDEIGRSVFSLDKYFFKDLNGSLVEFRHVLETIKIKGAFALYGELLHPTQPNRLAIRTTDITCCIVETSTALTDPVIWLYDDINVYKLCRPATIEDCRFVNKFMQNLDDCIHDLNSVQIYSVLHQSKVHVSQVCSNNLFVVYWYEMAVNNFLKLNVIDHRLLIQSVNGSIMHQFQVCDDCKKWYSISSFANDDLSPFYKGIDYDWPNEEGLTWRVVSDFSVYCNGKLCPLTSLPKWKDLNAPVFKVTGRLVPPPPSRGSSSSSSSSGSSSSSTSNSNSNTIRKGHDGARKPLNVELEFDVLFIEFDENGRGFWVNNVLERQVYYKLEITSKEYSSYCENVISVLMLYDCLGLICEKDREGKFCVAETIEQIHEVSDGRFNLQFVQQNKEFVLTFIKEFVNLAQSKTFVKSISSLPPVLSDVGKDGIALNETIVEKAAVDRECFLDFESEEVLGSNVHHARANHHKGEAISSLLVPQVPLKERSSDEVKSHDAPIRKKPKLTAGLSRDSSDCQTCGRRHLGEKCIVRMFFNKLRKVKPASITISYKKDQPYCVNCGKFHLFHECTSRPVKCTECLESGHMAMFCKLYQDQALRSIPQAMTSIERHIQAYIDSNS